MNAVSRGWQRPERVTMLRADTTIAYNTAAITLTIGSGDHLPRRPDVIIFSQKGLEILFLTNADDATCHLDVDRAVDEIRRFFGPLATVQKMRM